MRLTPMIRRAAIALVLLSRAPSASAEQTWSLTRFYDDINAITVKIAAIGNERGAWLKVHATTAEDKVWITFLPPADDPAGLAPNQPLRWQLGDGRQFSRETVTRTLARQSAEQAADLRHAGPGYSSFVIAESGTIGDPAAPLSALRDGPGPLRLSYALENAPRQEAVFTLRGAEAAIGEIMALFSETSTSAPQAASAEHGVRASRLDP